MNWAIFYSEAATTDCVGLPDEALAALGEVEAQLSEHPYLGDPNPTDLSERSIDFGDRGQGALMYVLNDDDKRISFTSIIWLG